MSERRIEVAAPAKVNPYLAVLGKREDGFHELDTVLIALELADQVILECVDGPAGQVTCEVSGPQATPDVPTDDRNLAVRAVKACAGPKAPALHLTLLKEIPSQAGLGGGSSDAAAAWYATERLLDQAEDGRAARGLAALGSDCVFFHAARRTGCARGTGRGEEIEVLDVPWKPPAEEWWVALITPVETCPTGAVYGALTSSLSPPVEAPRVRALTELSPLEARNELRNDLEPAAHSITPGLLRWREALVAADADHFRLSGSGSSLFGIYASASDAAQGLAGVMEQAQRMGLESRARFVTRACGHGVIEIGSKSR